MAIIINYCKIAGLEQQKCIFSLFWRLEDQDQDVVGGSGGGNSFLLWLLLLGHLFPLSSRGLPSVYVSVQISSPYKDISHIGLEFTLMTSL